MKYVKKAKRKRYLKNTVIIVAKRVPTKAKGLRMSKNKLRAKRLKRKKNKEKAQNV